MADVHYEVDETEKPGRDLMDAMRSLAVAWDKLTRIRGVLIANKVGGENDFSQIAERYGYSGSDTAAKEAAAAGSFGEIDSAFGNGDAAITQMLNRHL